MHDHTGQTRPHPFHNAPVSQERLVSQSPAIQHALEAAHKNTRQTCPVLLEGEAGVGKQRIAKWIHQHSANADGPFFSIHTGTMSHEKAELELFGEETESAHNGPSLKRGILERAHGGTLLIKDVDKLDKGLQANLLHYLETRHLLRIGGETLIPVDTRIMTTCSSPLEDAVKRDSFMKELYYRISILPVKLPPLRSRRNDIPYLAREVLSNLALEFTIHPAPELTSTARDKLQGYSWPGNIRELRNVLERALILDPKPIIDADDLPIESSHIDMWHHTVYFPQQQTLHDTAKDVCRHLIEEALRRSKTKNEAAALLGITRHALAHQIKTLGISLD